MGTQAGQMSYLGTIQESGFSRTPSNTSSNNVAELTIDVKNEHDNAGHMGGDSDEDGEEFQYPTNVKSDKDNAGAKAEHGGDEEDEEGFQYPGDSEDIQGLDGPESPQDHISHEINDKSTDFPHSESETLQHASEAGPSTSPRIVHPSPAQLEALSAAGLSGDLELLQKLIQNACSTGDIEPFAMVNDASPRTGLTVLHATASRGYVSAVAWLIEECGGIPDLEDREGETALHKAALNGHLPVIECLIPAGADVHSRDADGWTALHNASSKGYLDIVRWLCEGGGAADAHEGVRGVDARSKLGWTPLMNAASKGHLPVVLYLLNKQGAGPLVRNNWGETAYDVAAAVFEIWICEVLQKAEAERWRGTTVPYDPLAVHTTVPIILYENQRLDVRLKTLALNGGRPRFSSSGLGRRGRRAPFELMLPKADVNTGKMLVPAWRSDIQLPLIEDPFTMPYPKGGKEGPSREGAERSQFWLSDWMVDLTHPRVDAEEGWQYAHSFNDPDEEWVSEVPPQLERLLAGSGVMTAGLSGPGSRSISSSSNVSSNTWVRRRRWVRVLRRRLDISPLPFLQPDGVMYQLSGDGTLVPCADEPIDQHEDSDGQELGSMPATFLSTSHDYVARSRYLAGSHRGADVDSVGETSAVETRRAIAKLERAVMELRTGMLGDEDQERRTQAEVLLNAYSRELERKRLAAGAAGLFSLADGTPDCPSLPTIIDTYTNPDDQGDDDDDYSDDSFHYPGSSPVRTTTTPRPPSVRSQGTDYFGRVADNRASTDLTPHLAQAPEFRVPTHEMPQKVSTPRRTPPTPHTVHAQWERDETVSECRACKRRFTFLFRKHHCRRCGRIFCDRCSSYRSVLDPSDVIHDPALPDSAHGGSSHRVCETCHDEVNASVPSRLQGSRTVSMERIVVDQARLAVPSHLNRVESTSQISDLADCPVCGHNLADLDNAPMQAAHVKTCLEGGVGSLQQPAKYLVYRLPEESTLIGVECVICLEEFAKGSMIARLSCLCSFHNTCLSAWLQRGRACPIHARDT